MFFLSFFFFLQEANRTKSKLILSDHDYFCSFFIGRKRKKSPQPENQAQKWESWPSKHQYISFTEKLSEASERAFTGVQTGRQNQVQWSVRSEDTDGCLCSLLIKRPQDRNIDTKHTRVCVNFQPQAEIQEKAGNISRNTGRKYWG